MPENDLSIQETLSQKVKEKIKKEFTNLIPDEAWDELVKKEIEEFLKKDVKHLVREILRKDLQKKLEEELDSQKFFPVMAYENNGATRVDIKNQSHLIQHIIKECASSAMENIIGNWLSNFMMAFRNNMPSQY